MITSTRRVSPDKSEVRIAFSLDDNSGKHTQIHTVGAHSLNLESYFKNDNTLPITSVVNVSNLFNHFNNLTVTLFFFITNYFNL